MYGGSWWLNGTMRIIFSLECPPSAKLLLESPDGAIKPLQLAQRSESSPKLWQILWIPEKNEIVGTPIIFCPMLIFSFPLRFSTICCPYFVQLVSPSKVSQRAQLGVFGATFCAIGVLVFYQKCLRERSWMALELYLVHLMSHLSIKSVPASNQSVPGSAAGCPCSYILCTWCPGFPSKVSQRSQLVVPGFIFCALGVLVFHQKCPREGSWVSLEVQQLPVLASTLCLCAAFVRRNKFCSTDALCALYSRPE